MPDFGVCLNVLDGIGGTGAAPADPHLSHLDDSWVTAHAFLDRMGYLPREQAAGGPLEESRRILEVAARLDRVFTVPLGRSPGVQFFGAQVRPAAYGNTETPGSRINAAGRGLTPRVAFESCVGEAVEHVSMGLWPEDALREHRTGASIDGAADPAWCAASLGLSAGNLPEGLDWVPGEALDGGGRLWFPVDLCLRRPEPRAGGALAAESNGCAAAPSADLAALAALGEVIERDAIARWWWGGVPAVAVAPAYLEETGLAGLLREIRPQTRRIVWLLSLPGLSGVPVAAALSSEPDGSAVVAGFAAGCDPVAVMRRAVLEMCQMELAQDLAVLRAQEEGAAALSPRERVWLDRWRHLSVAAYPRLRGIEGPAPEACGDLPTAVARAGFTAYRLDLTRPALGIPVVRVLVPGLQSADPARVTPRLHATAARYGVNLQERLHEYSPI